MCTLILLRGVVPGFPLVLAMNRDEFLDRPSAPPRLWPEIPAVAPVDLRAGGTWFGVGRQGLAVALTNRGHKPDPAKRSRGALTLDLLRAPSHADALVHLLRFGGEHNGFNAVLGDRDALSFAFHEDRDVRVSRGHSGVSVLTNAGLDTSEAKVAAVHERLVGGSFDSLDETLSTLRAALVLHDAPVCRHETDRGTRSSVVWALSAEGLAASHLLFADGPPCTAPYEDCSALVRELAAGL